MKKKEYQQTVRWSCSTGKAERIVLFLCRLNIHLNIICLMSRNDARTLRTRSCCSLQTGSGTTSTSGCRSRWSRHCQRELAIIWGKIIIVVRNRPQFNRTVFGVQQIVTDLSKPLRLSTFTPKFWHSEKQGLVVFMNKMVQFLIVLIHFLHVLMNIKNMPSGDALLLNKCV